MAFLAVVFLLIYLLSTIVLSLDPCAEMLYWIRTTLNQERYNGVFWVICYQTFQFFLKTNLFIKNNKLSSFIWLIAFDFGKSQHEFYTTDNLQVTKAPFRQLVFSTSSPQTSTFFLTTLVKKVSKSITQYARFFFSSFFSNWEVCSLIFFQIIFSKVFNSRFFFLVFFFRLRSFSSRIYL